MEDTDATITDDPRVELLAESDDGSFTGNFGSSRDRNRSERSYEPSRRKRLRTWVAKWAGKCRDLFAAKNMEEWRAPGPQANGQGGPTAIFAPDGSRVNDLEREIIERGQRQREAERIRREQAEWDRVNGWENR